MKRYNDFPKRGYLKRYDWTLFVKGLRGFEHVLFSFLIDYWEMSNCDEYCITTNFLLELLSRRDQRTVKKLMEKFKSLGVMNYRHVTKHQDGVEDVYYITFDSSELEKLHNECVPELEELYRKDPDFYDWRSRSNGGV